MNFFISDMHFGHKGALLWKGGSIRPEFSSCQEMDSTMILNWNSVVSNNDTVYFLGDFAFKCSKNHAEYIFNCLNGKKHLIIGNHDYKIAKNFKDGMWETINNLKEIDIFKSNGKPQKIILCHYPLLSWRHQYKGSWMLHGHCHGSIQKLNENIRRYDCSVEPNNYKPISFEELEVVMESKIII